MQVILKEDILNLGKAGDVVSVREGYGRNFLLPKKKAIKAESNNLKQLEHQKKLVAALQQKRKKEAEVLAGKIAALSITIGREAGEEDKLFGSITTKDVCEALRNEGFIVDRHDIVLDAPLKQLGIFEVPVKLHPEVTGTVKVWVVKK
jgi:large subunit ribosomal protein L9